MYNASAILKVHHKDSFIIQQNIFNNNTFSSLLMEIFKNDNIKIKKNSYFPLNFQFNSNEKNSISIISNDSNKIIQNNYYINNEESEKITSKLYNFTIFNYSASLNKNFIGGGIHQAISVFFNLSGHSINFMDNIEKNNCSFAFATKLDYNQFIDFEEFEDDNKLVIFLIFFFFYFY